MVSYTGSAARRSVAAKPAHMPVKERHSQLQHALSMADPSFFDPLRIPTQTLATLDWRPFHFTLQPYHYLVRMVHIIAMGAALSIACQARRLSSSGGTSSIFWPGAAMRASSSALSTRARKLQNTCPADGLVKACGRSVSWPADAWLSGRFVRWSRAACSEAS